MKKITILTILIMLVSYLSYAQENVKKVSQFKEGETLSQADVAFLNLVANTKVQGARGAGDKVSVKLKSKTFTTDQTLSKQDAAVIKSAVTSFKKTHKGDKKPGTLPAKSRDGYMCWYWYYYCDYYGNCAYYKYYYYCY